MNDNAVHKKGPRTCGVVYGACGDLPRTLFQRNHKCPPLCPLYPGKGEFGIASSSTAAEPFWFWGMKGVARGLSWELLSIQMTGHLFVLTQFPVWGGVGWVGGWHGDKKKQVQDK